MPRSRPHSSLSSVTTNSASPGCESVTTGMPAAAVSATPLHVNLESSTHGIHAMQEPSSQHQTVQPQCAASGVQTALDAPVTVSNAQPCGMPQKKARRRYYDASWRCHDCSRDSTPVRRLGPDGPRTLCNACGLRRSKRKRIEAAAALKAVTVAVASESNSAPNSASIPSPASTSVSPPGNRPSRPTSPFVPAKTSPSAIPPSLPIRPSSATVSRLMSTSSIDSHVSKLEPSSRVKIGQPDVASHSCGPHLGMPSFSTACPDLPQTASTFGLESTSYQSKLHDLMSSTFASQNSQEPYLHPGMKEWKQAQVLCERHPSDFDLNAHNIDLQQFGGQSCSVDYNVPQMNQVACLQPALEIASTGGTNVFNDGTSFPVLQQALEFSLDNSTQPDPGCNGDSFRSLTQVNNLHELGQVLGSYSARAHEPSNAPMFASTREVADNSVFDDRTDSSVFRGGISSGSHQQATESNFGRVVSSSANTCFATSNAFLGTETASIPSATYTIPQSTSSALFEQPRTGHDVEEGNLDSMYPRDSVLKASNQHCHQAVANAHANPAVKTGHVGAPVSPDGSASSSIYSFEPSLYGGDFFDITASHPTPPLEQFELPVMPNLMSSQNPPDQNTAMDVHLVDGASVFDVEKTSHASPLSITHNDVLLAQSTSETFRNDIFHAMQTSSVDCLSVPAACDSEGIVDIRKVYSGPGCVVSDDHFVLAHNY